MNAPQPRETWRVAALTMMSPAQLASLLAGDDAAPWVEAAAACGIVEAQVRLGRMLLEGQGVAKDERAAFACFLCAAESDDAHARNMLGRCYENGWGTAKDMVRAAENYRIAAEAGLDWAQYNLGHLLLDGIGVARIPDEAFVWYMRAAMQGHVRAMNLVARCCEEGWGTFKDQAAARVWYRKSAEGGYFRGAYNYASILAAEGCVTGAARWFAQAVATAPEPTRGNMLRVLARDPRFAGLVT
ncbi:MAG TPA: tetratricopeptide repeat protein [Rhizomicrobium sp.]|nr:tetratricopeptide repeat protein [Rhizomicrobium sp.]